MNILYLLLLPTINAINIAYYQQPDLLIGINITSTELINDINIKFIIGSRLVYRPNTEKNYSIIISDNLQFNNNCLLSTFYIIDGPNLFFRLCYINETYNFGITKSIATFSYSFALNKYDPTLLYYAYIVQNPLSNNNFSPFIFRDGRFDFDRITLQFPQLLVSGDTSGVLYLAYNCGISKCNNNIICNKNTLDNEICTLQPTQAPPIIQSYNIGDIGALEILAIVILICIVIIFILNIYCIYSIRGYLKRVIGELLDDIAI